MLRSPLYWLGLVVLFVVSYLVVGIVKPDPASFKTWVPAFVAVVFVTLFIFFFWLQVRGRKDCLDGSRLMSEGRLEEALVLLTRAVAKSPTVAAFGYVRACCLLQLLRLEEAERAFSTAAKLSQPKGLRENYDTSAQLVVALQGKQALAVGSPAAAERVLTRAVEFVRKGEWQAALDQLSNPSQQMLWGTTRVLSEALRAWCQEKLGGAKREVDLTLLRQPGMADVRAFWPELAEQLAL